MRRGPFARAVAPFSVAAVVGCASVPEDAGFGDVQGLVTERAGLEIQWNQDTLADLAVQERVRLLLGREMSVEETVQVALLNHPGLQATYEELGIAQADLVEAGLLKNPIFEFEMRFPGDPREPLEVHLIQDFLDLFLLPMKKRVAESRFEQAKLQVADAVLEVASDVRTAFYELQAAQQLVEMRQSVVAATEASVDAAQRIHAAGNITDLALEKQQALAAEAKLDLAQAETEVWEGRERLNILMGVWGKETAWTIPGRLPDLPPLEISSVGLETLAVSRNLALEAARQEIEATASRLGFTDASALIPEVNLGIHDEREPDGTNTLGPSIELPLPFFNQGQPQKFRARSLLRQVQQRYLERAITLRSDVRRLRERMLSARRIVEYHLAVELPLRRRIREHTQLEYNAMQEGVFELLEAKQDEIKAGHDFIEALRDYWVARTGLEQAVGGRLSVDDSPSSKTPQNETDPQIQKKEEPSEHHHHGGQS